MNRTCGRMRGTMKFLDIDSPLMQAMSKMADLMILNLLTLVCCLPIITIGASLTAMHYMTLKIVRNEECYIARGFFKSFKENFKQGTLIWLILLVLLIILTVDFFIINSSGTEFNAILMGLITVIAILVVFTTLYAFPVLARFRNTIRGTLKNALLMSIMQFPKTVIMIVVNLLPVILFLFVYPAIPIVLLFGLSVPAWVSAKLNNKLFKTLEDKFLESQTASETEIEKDGDDERIFKDELDNSLQDKSFQ